MTRRNTTECTKCGKHISLSNIKKHEKSCKGIIEKPHRTKCKFCDRSFKTPQGRGLHERQCSKNPNQKGNWNKGKTSWAKGLDKSDPRIYKMSKSVADSMKRKYANGEITPMKWTPEMKKAQSDRKKNLYKKYPEKHPNRRLANNRSKMSYPEKIAWDFLTQNNIKFEHQKKISRYYVDFIIGKNIIEIDGEYWHPDNNDKDIKRDKILNDLGYNVFRIKAKERIENRLLDILKEIGLLT